MILLAFFYISFAFAFPTPSDFPTDNSPSLFIRSANIFGSRSIWSICWSCLATIFACTWVVVHPNIPGPNESRWSIFRRRLAIMGCALIGPEFVITWAARQHLAAKQLAKQYPQHKWTMAHGFFLDMGGFTLHDQAGSARRILTPPEFHELYTSGKIKCPPITEEEIQDRSKGDFLSKSIALVQTSWFIAQYITRAVHGLAVTELEVATLAFAALSGVMYYLWWHKPLEVRCSVPVYLQENDEIQTVDAQSLPLTSYPPSANPVLASHPIISSEPTTNLDQIPIHLASLEQRPIHPMPLVVSCDPNTDPQGPDTSNLIPPSSNDHSTAYPIPNRSRIQELSNEIQQGQHHETFIGLTYLFYPIRPFFDMANSHDLDESLPLHLPTFYSSKISDDEAFLWCIAICVASVFGAIHCIAWSYHFPSLQERLAWRISAAVVSGLPIFISLINMLMVEPYRVLHDKCYLALFVAAMFLYFVARIMLLVLPCITLRALPPTAFDDIQWVSFLPHMG